jgi:hypothetical protein
MVPTRRRVLPRKFVPALEVVERRELLSATARILDASGNPFVHVSDMAVVGKDLYFTCRKTIWLYDGISPPHELQAAPGQKLGTDPSYLTSSSSTLYFVAQSNGPQLYAAHGGKVSQLTTLSSSSSLNTILQVVPVGGSVDFLYEKFSGGGGLSVILAYQYRNGKLTPLDFISGSFSGRSDPSSMTAVGNNLFITTGDSDGMQSLWVISPNSTGPELLLHDGTVSSPAAVGPNLLLFAAGGLPSTQVLFSSDGTAAHTGAVVLNGPSILKPEQFILAGSRVFFAGLGSVDKTGAGKENLYSMTTSGTDLQVVATLGPGYSNSYTARPSQLTAVGNKLYFVYIDSASGNQLESVSSSGRPDVVKTYDINPKVIPGVVGRSSDPTNLVNLDGRLYLGAFGGTYGETVWTIQADGTPVNIDIPTQEGRTTDKYNLDPLAHNLVSFDHTLVFAASTSSTDDALFQCSPNAQSVDKVGFVTTESTASSATGFVLIPISLSAPSSMPVTVHFGVIGGTAPIPKETKTPYKSIATIPAHQKRSFIRINFKSAHLVGTTVIIGLSTPNGAALGSFRTHAITITA